MIFGVGTDIVEISRVRKAIENERFLERVYTEKERAYCESRGAQAPASYAARFSAKEAVLKAFGTGLRGGSLLDVEVLPDALGSPRVFLHGTFARMAEEKRIAAVHISLSHAREYATAQCVMEART